MADVAGLYKRAEEAFAKKNYDYARDLFLNILALDPDHELTHKSLYAACLKKIQERGQKSRITTFFGKGKIQVQLSATKDPVKKIELALKHLCEEPYDAAVRTTLAQLLLDLGHPGGAAAEADTALSIDGKNLGAAKILVAALTKLNRIEEAEKILEKVVAHAGEDRDIAKLRRDIAAMTSMKKTGIEKADTYRNIIKNKDQAAILEIQHHTIQTDEQFQALLEDLKKEMDKDPTDPRIPKKIGDLFFERKKDFTEAREWYKKASALAPQDSVMRDKVDDCGIRLLDGGIEAALKNNDPTLAQLKADRLKFVIQSFERRVQDRPTDMVLRYELGKAYYQAGSARLDEAIHEFQQSVKDPKKKVESCIYLGHAFRKKKNYAMAETQYHKAEEAGTIPQSVQLEIWYYRALCSAEAGKKDLAIQLANKIIEIDINYRDISQMLEKWQNGA
ncbi:MAG: hypothetical protein HYY16_04580 [Planctomycetes bacterium]|nr:hypothetical protein [Planctomycetota bacterium]